MGNSNGFIQEPVGTLDVCNVIGVSTRDFGQQITLAKQGGAPKVHPVSGQQYMSAFKLKEMGYNSTELGEMIDGAVPYWNIWSPNKPAFLDKKATTSTKVSELVCRLDNKINGHDANIVGAYQFRLRGWANYNHNAKAPLIETKISEANNWTKSVVEVSIVYNDFNWSEIFNTNVANLGLYVMLKDYKTSQTVANVQITPKDLAYNDSPLTKIKGSVAIDVPYYSLDVIVNTGLASYDMINSGGNVTYDLNKAVMFGKLLGTLHINNTTTKKSYATFQWRPSPYYKDNNIKVLSQIDGSRNIYISGGYIYPVRKEDGTLNDTPAYGAILRYKVIDIATNNVVFTGSDSNVIPTRVTDDNLANRFSTNIAYAYSEFNLKIELYFE